jgi:pyruvate-ferredoxin/flavodoxin oxidoreductase
VIDATEVARQCGMGGRVNTIMQTCFFAISGILPREQAISAIKESIRKTYEKKGTEIVQMNLNAVDQTLSHLAARFTIARDWSLHPLLSNLERPGCPSGNLS